MAAGDAWGVQLGVEATGAQPCRGTRREHNSPPTCAINQAPVQLVASVPLPGWLGLVSAAAGPALQLDVKWAVRRAAVVAAAAVLLYCLASHRDFEKENFKCALGPPCALEGVWDWTVPEGCLQLCGSVPAPHLCLRTPWVSERPLAACWPCWPLQAAAAD